MTSISKKSGQIIRKLNRFSRKTSEKSKEHIKTHFLARLRSAAKSRLLIVEWLLLVSAITLFAIVQAVWYKSAYTTTVFVAGSSYSESTLGAVDSLNPLFAATTSEKTASRLLFSTLLSVDTTGRIHNHLARSIKHDSSGKIWTLTLRDNIYWSDGDPITADDIIYTFSVINDPAARTIYADSFSTVKIAKVDELTVTFTLPTVFADFPATLTVPLLPEHILGQIPPALLPEHTFSLSPIGSGPFVFDAIQQSATSKTVLLAKNSKYFQGEPLLSRFSLSAYSSEDELARALKNHDVTATAGITNPENYPTSADIYQKNAALNRGAFAFLNTSSEVLKTSSIRRAIRFALDIPALREELDISLPLDYPILRSQAEVTFPDIPKPDQVKAMELITAEGSGLTQTAGKLYIADDNAPAELTIATIDTGHLADFAKSIADSLSTLGFSVTINVLEPDESQIFFTQIVQPRAYDILLYEIDMGLYADLLPYYHSTQATTTGFNFSNYNNAVMNDLILSVRSTFDAELRRAKYEAFLRHWVDAVPAIGLYQSELTYFYNRGTRPFSENIALASPLDRFSDILYWASEKAPRYRTP